LRTIEKDSAMGSQDKRAIFLYADQVLGLELNRAPESKPLTPELEQLLNDRVVAREAKEWARSDSLRTELEARGLEISDGPTGQSWRWK